MQTKTIIYELDLGASKRSLLLHGMCQNDWYIGGGGNRPKEG